MIFSAFKRFSNKQRKSEDIARAFFWCFSTEEGQVVLGHLHDHVLFRITDPNMTAEQLRFVEGQRQLVLFICQTISKHNQP